MAEVTRESLIFLDLITPAPEVRLAAIRSVTRPGPRFHSSNAVCLCCHEMLIVIG
jgi:hypothetical protein